MNLPPLATRNSLGTLMAKSGNKSLKGALKSQQSRLKVKQKVSQAAQVADQKSKKNGQHSRGKPSKGKGKAVPVSPRRPTVPFRSTDKILLIGDGDFSFTRALIQDAPSELEFLPPSNITTTAYDEEEECYRKYPGAESIVSLLKEKGVEVLFKIDATKLEKVSAFKGRKWNRIVWNFPHAGASSGLPLNK